MVLSLTTSAPRCGSKTNLFPIVGIGASAGGLEAFTELLRHLPVDTGMGFVLVQHLDPAHESILPQILAKSTAMAVHEVKDRMRVEPNCVYVMPPNVRMSIARGVLKLGPRVTERGAHHTINFFFESLAKDSGSLAVGVVLSGSNFDGTLGLEAIKNEGGITFAQDERSARHDTMPRSAVVAGCVDFVSPPGKIGEELGRLARKWKGRPSPARTSEV
jgi:two-component system CheB/CheR fusion protein